jgi:hypothetical protein
MEMGSFVTKTPLGPGDRPDDADASRSADDRSRRDERAAARTSGHCCPGEQSSPPPIGPRRARRFFYDDPPRTRFFGVRPQPPRGTVLAKAAG